MTDSGADLDPAVFVPLLQPSFPGETVRVPSIEPFGDGHSGLTYLLGVETGTFRGDLVARLSPAGARIAGPSDVGRQGRIMAALHDAGLPAPRVLVADSSGEFLGRAVAVMARVDGVGWEPAAAASSDRHIVGLAVDLLHQIRKLAPAETGLGGETPFDNEAEVRRWGALASRCPDDWASAIGTLQHELLADPPPVSGIGLVHGDYHYGNLLFDGDRLVAVFDWEIAGLGDPLTDFGCLAVASLRRRYRPEPNPTGGLDVTMPDLATAYGVEPAPASWHIAAACFKYAVIIGYNLQLHRRGKKLDPIYEELIGTAQGLLVDGSYLLRVGIAAL